MTDENLSFAEAFKKDEIPRITTINGVNYFDEDLAKYGHPDLIPDSQDKKQNGAK